VQGSDRRASAGSAERSGGKGEQFAHLFELAASICLRRAPLVLLDLEQQASLLAARASESRPGQPARAER
jgi:hypothetical protein